MRAERPGEQRDRRVLDDDRVHASGRDPPDQLLDDRQLGLEHQRVERDVRARVGAMNQLDDGGEAIRRKVGGAGARVEAVVETEVDRIGTGSERRGKGRAITGGRENFGTTHGGRGPCIRHRRAEDQLRLAKPGS